MPLDLIPQPHSLRKDKGTLRLGRKKPADLVTLRPREDLKPDGYRLTIGHDGILLEVQSQLAATYGFRTLEQIASQSPKASLPCLRIHDWPDLQVRGIYYDVSRGRIPTLEQLKAQIALLATMKINHYQLYIEHTFRFQGHPAIGKGVSALTADDIRKLDAFCLGKQVALVPSFASFGHMSRILTLPAYRSLAEDFGVGRYAKGQARKLQDWQKRDGWTLAPANRSIYKLLDELFSELLPLFSSDRFNVCCDETWDLGLGQSHRLCKRKGKANVYLEHVKKLRQLAGKHGKRIMFWGDMIRKSPELIREVPWDTTVLDWNYTHNHKFNSLRDFTREGLDCYACPGTSSWRTLFPRIHEAAANIHGFAAAARKHRARGLLTTDWGDDGHYNFMEFSWHGYLFAAEQGWNSGADRKTFTRRFASLFLQATGQDLVKAIQGLGDVSHLSLNDYYQSIWSHVFFAQPGDPVLSLDKRDAWTSLSGQIRKKKVHLNAALGRATIKKLETIRRVLAAHAAAAGTDPHGILPYWVFAADTLTHAARKLTILGPGGRDSAAGRRRLKKELSQLMVRFEKLWRAGNRPSEIKITLTRYKAIIKSL